MPRSQPARSDKASAETAETDKSRGGRPRNAALDVAILEATRRHLVSRGYSQLAIAEVAVEAGVSRPTIYRRWSTKFDLVREALDYGLRAQERKYAAAGDPLHLPPFEAFQEAVRRVDPCWANPAAIVLQGNIIGETDRTPELVALTADHAVNPRVGRLEEVIRGLRDAGHIRADVDVHTIATMCFGAFFGAHLRGERNHVRLAEQVTAATWPLLSSAPPSKKVRSRAAASAVDGRRQAGPRSRAASKSTPAAKRASRG